jgi:glucose-1-phosphate thymidylyltransferase
MSKWPTLTDRLKNTFKTREEAIKQLKAFKMQLTPLTEKYLKSEKNSVNKEMKRKGIILAGGHGTRLRPLTYCTCKQLLPVYNHVMVEYPISTLLAAGIEDITFIVKSIDKPAFQNLLNNINPDSVKFDYRFVIQDDPKGLSEAFILAERYIKGYSTALVLGDNLFYGSQFDTDIKNIMPNENVIFGYKVKNPSAYGVAVLDENGNITGVVEKPETPPTNYAIPGLYFFDETCIEKAKNCKPSKRGELEIVDIINQYIKEKNIALHLLDNHTAWFDCGTHADLLDAANFVRAIETRTNTTVCKI